MFLTEQLGLARVSSPRADAQWARAELLWAARGRLRHAAATRRAERRGRSCEASSMRRVEQRDRRYEASSPRSFACRRRGVFAAELRMPEAQSWPRTVFFAGNVKSCVTFVNWAEA